LQLSDHGVPTPAIRFFDALILIKLLSQEVAKLSLTRSLQGCLGDEINSYFPGWSQPVTGVRGF